MAYGTYLVVARTGTLNALAAKIAAAIGTDRGDPLVAVGARRALVVPQVAEALAAARPDLTLGEYLAILGAQSVEALDDARIASLIGFRDGPELTLERSTPRKMSGGGYDWHLAAVRLPQAWKEVRGAPGNIDWEGIQVGQIDTGYTENPCLGWASHASAVVNTRDDRNFFTPELSGDPDPFVAGNRDPLSALDPLTGPNGGHGTRTASILAGFDESPAAKKLPGTGGKVRGFYGAAPKVPYVPIRLSNCVMIDNMVRELGDALEYLLEQVRCQVITLSMGAAPALRLPRKMRDMIDRAYERGVIVCCAAGNYVPFVTAPASSPRTIAVAGSAPGDRPWNGSSFGRYADIAAPGWPVRRANTLAEGAFEYGYGEGTSYATPQVSGTAALWLAKHGSALDKAYAQPWMRVAAFLQIVTSTARKPPLWDTGRYGAGILDAASVLQATLPPAAALRRDDEPHFVDYPAVAEPSYA